MLSGARQRPPVLASRPFELELEIDQLRIGTGSMLMQVIHTPKRSVPHQHVFLDASNLGAGLAHDDFGVGIGEDLFKPGGWTEGHHFLVRAVERDSNCIMKKHDHDRIASL